MKIDHSGHRGGFFLTNGVKRDGRKGIFVLNGWNGRNDGGFTWKHFTHKTARSADPSFFPTRRGACDVSRFQTKTGHQKS